MLDFDNLQKMIDDKYISVQKHPGLDLFIYNYTQRAQFDRVWNNETLRCRGLMMDSQHNIVARPFPKFFNLEEILAQGGQIPAEDFLVTEKMDGSLGILYVDADGRPALATRGSFTSEQAVKGTEILRTKYKDALFSPELTYLFEIIYPSNRIVVDYGEMEDIVLLAVIDTQTGRECTYDFIKECAHSWGVPVVQKYDAIKDFTQIEQRPNSEGYVISFPSTGQRFKIKFQEYVRLHRLVTGVNARSVWDLLRNNQPFEELLEKVPDEFFKWVTDTREDLKAKFLAVHQTAMKDYEEIRRQLEREYGDEATEFYPKYIRDNLRKDFALKATKTQYPKLLFLLLEERDDAVGDLIWRMIKPAHEIPFRKEEE